MDFIEKEKRTEPKGKKIGKYWSEHYSNKQKEIKAWWDSDIAKNYVNRLIADTDSTECSGGLNQLLIQKLNGRHLKTGISVGCGPCDKEMRLIELGIVDKFIVFDLSEVALELGKERAKELGMLSKIEFHCEDAFLYDFSDIEIDLVHWNNSLHHMFDVPAAIKWSYDILIPNGVFYMDDYVGPNRFQYSDKVLQIANNLIQQLIGDNSNSIAHLKRCNPEMLAQLDPSEAVDSERILESVERYFPHAQVVLTGGIVYFATLTGLYSMFDENNENHVFILKSFLEADRMLTEQPDIPSLYATALAFK